MDSNKAVEIREFCESRNITDLFHYTFSWSVVGILDFGILSRRDLFSVCPDMIRVLPRAERSDDHFAFVSLSISFPNYKLFHKIAKPKEDWVVILLKPQILWELDCVFCTENAASNNVKEIPVSIRKSTDSLKLMFGDFEDIKRASLNIPDKFPTNPQAVVSN